MKILMLLDHVFPPDIRVENEISALSHAGHEVHLACFYQEGKPIEEVTETCTIHRRKISKFIYKTSVGALKMPFYFNFWRKYTHQLFKNQQFDVVHVHDLPLAKIGNELKIRYGVKFILDLHENWPVLLQLSQHTNTFLGKILSSNNQWIRYEKKMCQKADSIIVVVDEAKNRINSLGISNDKIVTISNTLNISQFDIIKRENFNKDKISLLYVGGINYHRGLQYVLDTVKLLKNRNINTVFNIVGEGRYLNILKQKANDLNLEDSIVFHGYRKADSISDLYETTDIAIIPHIKSGHTDNTIPHKIFQYMYANIPILVSNCNPLVRIVKETNCGMYYTYDNSEELAEIIENFYRNPALLQNYVGGGRQSVIDKYNWNIEKENLLNLYKALI